MAYITSAERIGMKKGFEQGLQQGIRHERMLLSRQLTRRFGALPSQILLKIEQANAETLLAWGERIFDAKTIEEFFSE